jgi:hypothetical protein
MKLQVELLNSEDRGEDFGGKICISNIYSTKSWKFCVVSGVAHRPPQSTAKILRQASVTSLAFAAFDGAGPGVVVCWLLATYASFNCCHFKISFLP